MDKLDTIFLLFSVTCFFILGFSISNIIENKVEVSEQENMNSIPMSEQEIIDNCYNLTLEETAFCLRDEILTFYNYTVTDDKIAKNMTLDEIKELGGDCGVYSFLYKRLAEELGFESNTNKWNGKKDIYPGHRWATIWDSETYCRLDQLSVTCKERLDHE